MGLITLTEMRAGYIDATERLAELQSVIEANTWEDAPTTLAELQERMGEQVRRLDAHSFGIRDYYALAADGIGRAVDWKILAMEGYCVQIDTMLCRAELRCISHLLGDDNIEQEKAGPGGYYIMARSPLGYATRWQYRTGDYVLSRLRRLTQEAQ